MKKKDRLNEEKISQSVFISMYFFFLAQRIKGFNPKVKFDFILLEANMLEDTSVFKVGGQQRCPVELLDCPLCTVIDCAPSPPGDLTH